VNRPQGYTALARAVYREDELVSEPVVVARQGLEPDKKRPNG